MNKLSGECLLSLSTGLDINSRSTKLNEQSVICFPKYSVSLQHYCYVYGSVSKAVLILCHLWYRYIMKLLSSSFKQNFLIP